MLLYRRAHHVLDVWQALTGFVLDRIAHLMYANQGQLYRFQGDLLGIIIIRAYQPLHARALFAGNYHFCRVLCTLGKVRGALLLIHWIDAIWMAHISDPRLKCPWPCDGYDLDGPD